jgi:class 3 adenylate cyclase
MGLRQWELYVRAHAATLAAMLDLPDVESLNAAMLQSASPESLAASVEALRSVDLTSSLGAIRTPTLVFSGGDYLPTVALTQDVVAGIADARVIRLQSSPDIFEVPSLPVIPHVVRFVLGREAREHAPDGGSSKTAQGPVSGTAVILFADIADSTALTERMGDAGFRERARTLDASLRSIIDEAGGAAIDGKLLGDGVLATFHAAAQAIDAALRCSGAGSDAGLPLHLGVHAGDVIREENNVFGGAVNLASRISAMAAPGEVLVSDIVRGLARTSSGVMFEDRGEHALKGIAEPQRVFAVRAQA